MKREKSPSDPRVGAAATRCSRATLNLSGKRRQPEARPMMTSCHLDDGGSRCNGEERIDEIHQLR
jgi:hypothetical protein